MLTSMVSCLFAREVYKNEMLANCLNSVGYSALADKLDALSQRIQKLRWKARLATGFDPHKVTIPKRFTEIKTWKGAIDTEYLTALKNEYAKRIIEMGT